MFKVVNEVLFAIHGIEFTLKILNQILKIVLSLVSGLFIHECIQEHGKIFPALAEQENRRHKTRHEDLRLPPRGTARDSVAHVEE
jgi:hypothetical protein